MLNWCIISSHDSLIIQQRWNEGLSWGCWAWNTSDENTENLPRLWPGRVSTALQRCSQVRDEQGICKWWFVEETYNVWRRIWVLCVCMCCPSCTSGINIKYIVFIFYFIRYFIVTSGSQHQLINYYFCVCVNYSKLITVTVKVLLLFLLQLK